MTSRPLQLCRLAAVLVAALVLTACHYGSGTADYVAHNLSGVMPDLTFNLTNTRGEPVTAKRYAGKLVILYFGYTNCPDICPATMARLRASLAGLPPQDRQKIDVLFVSVDPKRDTPRKLARWVGSFGPEFIGLTGTQAQLRALTKRYHVTYGYGDPNDRGFYTVSHSSALFVFDPQGRVRLLANQRETIDQLTQDLETLLAHSATG